MPNGGLNAATIDKLRIASMRLEADTVAFTQQLVRIPTENPKLAQIEAGAESLCQDLIETRLRELGCRTDRWDVYPGRPDLVGTLPGAGGGHSLILNGHIDVVPAGNLANWNRPPFAAEIADGKIWGRGSVDMKGGIAAMIGAVQAIMDSGVQLKGDLILESVVDEETGGPGTTSTIERGHRADAVIVVEPTDLRINPVEGGLEWLRVVVRGVAGHSANRFKTVHAGGQGVAVNAIEKMAKILQSVQELERDWGNTKRHPLLPPGITTINPGVMIGGTGGGSNGMPNVLSAVSTFPDYCSLELSLKYLPGEKPAAIRSEFEEYITRVAAADPWLRENPPEIEWGIRGVSFPPAETSPGHPLITALAHATEQVTGRPPVVEGFTAVSDLAWFGEAGIPGAIFGPGSIASAHGDNEFIEIAELSKGVFALAMTICEWCGIAEDAV